MNRVPDSIGKYKVLGEIARGGMGAIYKAQHPTLERIVVIKKLTMGGSAAVRERFKREASIMMDFRNEYIVDVFDHFKEGNSHYIVQEYVDGLSLEALLARERYLPERIALLIFRDVCLALKYAHDHGVVHRDIKPGNLLLSKRGEVKLVDFGIARIEDDSGDSLTREGMTLGTPSYMAPEQFGNTKNVDKRADIYSLGVMLYESVTGKKPYPGSISPETIRLIQQGRYKPPRKANPALTPFMASIVRKTMHAKLSRRYRDLAPLTRKLEKRLARLGARDEREELSSYLAGTWTPPSVKGRVFVQAAATAAGCLALAAGGLLYARQAGWQYEYAAPSEYGAVVVSARIPKGPRRAEGIFVAAELFVDDGKETPKYEKGAFEFRRDPNQETESIAVYVSKPVYAPVGNYRLKVQVDGRLFWNAFYLASRLEQRADAAEERGKVVRIAAEDSRPLPLEVSVRAVSAADGLPATVGSNVLILRGGDWTPLDGEVAGSLMSGSVQKIRVEREGFYPALFSLLVHPFQSQLRIDCELVPYPAALVLKTELEGVDVFLDQLGTYREWGPRPARKPAPRLSAGAAELRIAPGRHLLSLKYGTAWIDVPIDIDSATRAAFSIETGANKRDLRVRELSRAPAPELGR